MLGCTLADALTAPQFLADAKVSVAHGNNWQHVSHQQDENIVAVGKLRYTILMPSSLSASAVDMNKKQQETKIE